MSTDTTPVLSMTDFVDIVHLSGTPKQSKVRQVKQRPDYHPAFDFYRHLRERIVSTMESGQVPTEAELLGGVTDKKKQANYPDAVTGYLTWCRGKRFSHSPAPKNTFGSGTVQISVNPELCLTWRNEPHIIKLYFKQEPIDRYRIAIIHDLMEHSLRVRALPNAEMSVLDVRNAKLHTRKSAKAPNLGLIHAELAFIATLWPTL